jgi:hypothetical protein
MEDSKFDANLMDVVIAPIGSHLKIAVEKFQENKINIAA